mmetsp:Transcript_855/g.1512  ORF Transcript_855/g.1512 Transcript_855/m.1512 type:complete len:324 (+) Transcript_855:9-980(+)
MTPPSITLGLTPSIVSRYSAFVLDQYGVLHDGAKPLPGAVECVAHLKASNKKLAILSNTSAAPEAALERLYSTLGFAPGSFDVAVTSGGECSKHFREKISTPDKVTKVLLFTWSGEEAKIKTSSFLSSLGNVEITANPAECDVAVAHGSDLVLGDIDDLGGEVEHPLTGLRWNCEYGALDPWLRELSSRAVPMYSANPDLKVVTSNNDINYMPGVICKRYESEFDGAVTYFGKPHKEHFLACSEALGVAADQTCHVGDSLHHDILGANDAGMSSIFVGSGIHRDECMVEGKVDENMLGLMIQREGGDSVAPTHAVQLFKMHED